MKWTKVFFIYKSSILEKCRSKNIVWRSAQRIPSAEYIIKLEPFFMHEILKWLPYALGEATGRYWILMIQPFFFFSKNSRNQPDSQPYNCRYLPPDIFSAKRVTIWVKLTGPGASPTMLLASASEMGLPEVQNKCSLNGVFFVIFKSNSSNAAIKLISAYIAFALHIQYVT